MRYATIMVVALVAGVVALGPRTGGSATHQPVHDLAINAADVTILGIGTGDVAGDATAAGDFNGDGVEDLLVGAPFADGPGTGPIVTCTTSGDMGDRCATGEAYVVLGPLPPAIDLAVTSPALTVVGADPMDRLGFTLTAGDLDGDGKDDLVLSASSADGPGGGTCPNNFSPGDGVGNRCNGGQVYVIRGVDIPPAGGIIDLKTQAGMAVTIHGAEAGDRLGYSVAVGDLDGDGKDDLILGAIGADAAGNAKAGAGEVYVIRGVDLPPAGSTIDLATASLAVTIYGADANDLMGSSVAAGDFDGDGKDDLLLSAPWADAASEAKSRAGEAYVIRGADLPPLGSTIDLATTSLAVTIYGADANDRLGEPPPGRSLAVGDLDGDGRDDLILGADRANGPSNARSLAGEAYVILGVNLPAAGTIIDLETTSLTDLTVWGGAAGDRLGLMLAAGDLNGDGFDDLVVGVRFADGPGSDSGEAYVILGPRSGTIDLATDSPDFTILAAETEDDLGISATVGDFDGDGEQDLVLAAAGADGTGAGVCSVGGTGDRCSGGEVYVFFGPPPTDTDTDGVLDAVDNCPLVPNPDQANSDSQDGGDACDPCPSDASDTCDPDRSAGESFGSGGGTLITPDGSTSVTIPPGCFVSETSVSITGTQGTDFEITTNQGQGMALFSVNVQPSGVTCDNAEPFTLAFAWEDTAPNDDRVDGTLPPIMEDSLRITKNNQVLFGQTRCHDVAHPPPVPTISTPSCDHIANVFTFQVSGFSTFAAVSLTPSIGGVVELSVESDDATAERQNGRSHEREVAALAVALAAVGVVGVSWHRYRRRAG